VPVRYQLVIDCAEPDLLAQFWARALGYELAPVPEGFATWNDFYRDVGVPEEDLVEGADRISDPDGQGPSIWFHVVTETKTIKNRLHLDIHASGDRRDPIEARRERVDAEAARLADLGATITGALAEEGLDHYAVGMKDPEGNEFDIN
jgi:Glyoxalase-like domain